MAETSSGITEEEGQFNLSKQIADVAEVKFTDRGAGGDEPLQEPAGVSSDAASPAPVMPCVDVEMQFSTQPPVDVAPDSVCGIDMLAQPADYQIQPEQQQKEVAPECVPSAEIASDEIDELTKHAAAKKKKMSAGEPIYGSDGTVLTSGRLFTGGDAYSYGGPQGSSGLLKRDAMHTLGDVKDESGSSERPILNTKMSPMIFRVDHYSVMNLISRLRNSWAFNFLSDKLWESICPEGLDLTFYDAQGRAVKVRLFCKIYKFFL